MSKWGGDYIGGGNLAVFVVVANMTMSMVTIDSTARSLGLLRGKGVGYSFGLGIFGLPSLSAEHHSIRLHNIINYGHVYHKDVEQIPSDAGEEVRFFRSAFHRLYKQYPFPKGRVGIE